MHFPEKFYRLPLNFDHKKLLEEISAVDEIHWSPHPQAFKGNDALILLSNGGTINDLNYGSMEFTPCMNQLPYLKQVLDSFNTVIGRTRLMRLAPGEKVGRHSDISLYWWHRFRIHVPIVTDPEVKFYCEDTHVHMQAGEAWTFDNWRYHEVHNNSNITRVHLVIDTVGSPEIWKMLENESWNPQVGETLSPTNFPSTFIPYVENKETSFEREQHNIIGVLSPAELDAIADFLARDLDGSSLSREQIHYVESHLRYLKRAWRALFSAYGRDEIYYQDYLNLLTNVVNGLNTLEPKPSLISNGFLVAGVLKTQVSLTIQEVIAKQLAEGFKKDFQNKTLALSELSQRFVSSSKTPNTNKNTLNSSSTKAPEIYSSPIFIVSAPSAGGMLAEKLLANSLSIHVLDFQKKQQINQVFSAAYTPQQSDDENTFRLSKGALLKLFPNVQNTENQIKDIYFDNYLGLRIPSILAEFPNARFIYVYREPQENLFLLNQDWESTKFSNAFASKVTGMPWHHPLPSGWQNAHLNQHVDKLAFQYSAINQTIMHSLKSVPKDSIFSLDIQSVREQKQHAIEALCDFCNIPFGPKMRAEAENNLHDPAVGPFNELDAKKLTPLIQIYEQIQHWAESSKS